MMTRCLFCGERVCSEKTKARLVVMVAGYVAAAAVVCAAMAFM